MSDLKRALLEGTDYLETVELTQPGGGQVEVKVRPLSSREAAEVEALSAGGLKGPMDSTGQGFKLKVDVDVSVFQTQLWKADVRTVRYGLTHSEYTWTDEEVGSLPHAWVKDLASVVCRISGIQRRQVEPFREGDGGPGGDGGDRDAGLISVGDSSEAGANEPDPAAAGGPA